MQPFQRFVNELVEIGVLVTTCTRIGNDLDAHRSRTSRRAASYRCPIGTTWLDAPRLRAPRSMVVSVVMRSIGVLLPSLLSSGGRTAGTHGDRGSPRAAGAAARAAHPAAPIRQ